MMSGAGLPIEAVLPQLGAALAGAGGRAVLTAEPGAGKSTLAPLYLLRQAWAQKGQIILLEPRRLAARAVAARMAQLLGEAVGQTVGYAMRLERKHSAKTRLLVMTEGSFTRLILENPELSGIAAVIFDEFHERSLEADFGLALALDAASALRPDLRLLVMSATLDSAAVAALLAEGGKPAPVISAPGRSFPVEIGYRPRGADKSGRPERAEEAAAKACLEALQKAEGGALIFLPGQAEIKRCAALLAEACRGRADIIIAPLYGSLPLAAQQKALTPAPPGQRKIVLATSIAESALTIEDVRIVIDSGLSRLPVYHAARGITALQTARAARAAIAQRAGRAGRLAPGLALRLWHKGAEGALPAFQPAEILNADMSGLVLDCADFGILNPQTLRLLDAPPAPALAQARRRLQSLKALGEDGRITAFGRAVRQLGLPAELGAMLLAAAQDDARRGGRADNGLRAARLAVLLTEAGFGGAAEDLDARLEAFAAERSPRAAAAGALSARLAAKARQLAAKLPPESGAPVLPQKANAGALLARARRGYLAHLRGAGGAAASGAGGAADGRASYLLANGRGAFLPKASPLYGKKWLVCAALTGAANGESRILAAAEIDEMWLKQALKDGETRGDTVFFDAQARALRAVRRLSFGAIELESAPLPPPNGEAANQGWLAALREHGLGILPWNAQAEHLRARLGFLRAVLGPPWPDVGDEALRAAAPAWLAPFLPGTAALTDGAFLAKALAALPDYPLQAQLESLAPAHFTAPSGARFAVRYEGGSAVLAVRPQELYGLKTQPALAGGRAPLLLELLSPAGRVLQRTADIGGFWAGSWREVAAQMRGRYPKHFWPENPAEAAPARRARKREKA